MYTRTSTQCYLLGAAQENWQRPDGMPATREHLMMVLADLDDILIRASYSSEMRSSSISEVSMEVAVPNYSGLAQALEVEQCRCPPGYQGLSCQVTPPRPQRLLLYIFFTFTFLKSKTHTKPSCSPATNDFRTLTRAFTTHL